MAYYVLLSFDDEEEALTFVEHSDGESSIIHNGKVEAIYKRPTMFCQTPGGCTKGGRRSGGYTMGQKWGWWVCSICKKPSEPYWDSIVRVQSSFGKNILTKLFDMTEETQS